MMWICENSPTSVLDERTGTTMNCECEKLFWGQRERVRESEREKERGGGGRDDLKGLKHAPGSERATSCYSTSHTAAHWLLSSRVSLLILFIFLFLCHSVPLLLPSSIFSFSVFVSPVWGLFCLSFSVCVIPVWGLWDNDLHSSVDFPDIYAK